MPAISLSRRMILINSYAVGHSQYSTLVQRPKTAPTEAEKALDIAGITWVQTSSSSGPALRLITPELMTQSALDTLLHSGGDSAHQPSLDMFA